MADLNENQEKDLNNSIMILTIDIGNGICDKLRIHNINNYEQETYDFCSNYHLDFQTMKEINNQIQKVINENKIFNDEKETKNNKQSSNYQYKKNVEDKNNRKNNNIINNLSKRKNIPNKKIINRYNGNPLSYIKKRQKDSNKNNSYGILNNNTRVSTNSSKGSSIINNKQNMKIIKNVKNAFNIIKKNSIFNSTNTIKVKENNLENNNKIFNDINNNCLEYSSNNTNENLNDNNDNKKFNIEENNIIFPDLNEDKIDSNIYSKKRKESIEILNTEEIDIDNQITEKENNLDLINQKKEENESNKYNNNNDNNFIINKENESNKKKKEKNNHAIKNRANSERNNFKENQEILNKKRNSFNLTNKNNRNNFNITHYSSNKYRKWDEYSKEDIIKNYKKYKEEKFQNLIEKLEIEFKKQYTFHPRINKNKYNRESKLFFNEDNILNKKSKSLARFEKLYNDRISFRENRNKLKDQLDKEFSYKPTINKRSYAMINIAFSERLKLYTNRTKEKKNKLEQEIENKRKINEYFQPKLNINRNRELLKERNDNNDINKNDKYDKYNKQYLYSQKYEQKKQYLTEKYYEDRFRSPECCQLTNELFNYKKEKSFKKLFSLLDGDNDGKISYNCISIKKLPLYIKKIMEPIFYELKIENEELNQSEFIFVCEKYYNTLKYDQKRKLIFFDDELKKKKKMDKIEKETINYSFKPKINKKYINLTYDKNKNKNKLNRVSSYEKIERKINNHKNRIKSIDIRKLNFILNNQKNNDKLNENKKINLNIVNNISLCNLLTKKENKEDTNNNINHIYNNNLVIQNINNVIDREIKYHKDNYNDKINDK